MNTLELSFIIFVGLIVLLGSAISLFVIGRAYFGGRNALRVPPNSSRGGSNGQ